MCSKQPPAAMPCVPQAAMPDISTTSNQKQSASHVPWYVNSMDSILQVNGQEHSLCQCVLQVHSLHGHPLCYRCTHCVDRWCTHCAIGALIVLIGAHIVLPAALIVLIGAYIVLPGALIALTGAHCAIRCPQCRQVLHAPTFSRATSQ